MSATDFVRDEITPAVDAALNELVEERMQERRPSRGIDRLNGS